MKMIPNFAKSRACNEFFWTLIMRESLKASKKYTLTKTKTIGKNHAKKDEFLMEK